MTTRTSLLGDGRVVQACIGLALSNRVPGDAAGGRGAREGTGHARTLVLQQRFCRKSTLSTPARPHGACRQRTGTSLLNLSAGHGWFVPYYVDVGTGASHFTWQGIAGIGYAFSWGELLGVWRYLDYDFKSGKTIKSLSLDGPAVGVAFRW